MHKFGINLYGVFVGKSKTAYFWSLILFRACLVAVFNKNSVFNLRREKLPCISVSHNHYLSLSLFFPLSPSLRYKTQKFLQKKKNSKKSTKLQFAKPIKQPNTPNLKTEEEDSVQERKRPKKKKPRKKEEEDSGKREREREREREMMILKTGPRTKSNLPLVLNFLSFIWFFPVLGLFSKPK